MRKFNWWASLAVPFIAGVIGSSLLYLILHLFGVGPWR